MNLSLRKLIKLATYGLLAFAAVGMSFLPGGRSANGHGYKVTNSDFHAGVPIAHADAPIGDSVSGAGDGDDDDGSGDGSGGCDGSDDDDDG